MTEQTSGARRRPWPCLRSLQGYSAASLPADLIAGVTLAAIAIPEQMATSKLGGFTPEIGFFAFIAGSLGFALLGANRFLSAGADSTITPIFAGGLALLATSGTPDYQALAAALALLVGLLLMGTAHQHERPRAIGLRSNDRDAAPSLVGEGAASSR
jgi:SulP family sulfate permease